MKPTKKQQQLGLAIGLATVGTLAVLAFSPLGNFFMSSLFGQNPTTSDAGLYLGYPQETASGTVMRVGTGVHMGSNDTRYGTGSTIRLRAVVTLVPRGLDVNSFSGVLNYDPQDLTLSPESLLMSGSGFTLDNAITRVVRNAADSESLYFSIDKNSGDFLKAYHQFLTVEMTPVRTLPSYALNLESFRFLNTAHLATGTSDSLYLDTGTAGATSTPLIIAPGDNYIMERIWIDDEGFRHVEETLYNNLDQRLQVTERVYDNEDGNLLRETITYYEPGGDTPIREIYREYHPDGVTVSYERDTVYNEDGTRTITETWYDEEGNVTDTDTRTEGTPTPPPVTDRPPVVTLNAAQSITGNSATFSWVGSNMDAGESFTYRFCLSTAPGTVLANCTAMAAGTTAIRNDLTASTTYHWTVLVSDGTSTDVAAANGPMSFTTSAATPPPSSGGGSAGGGGSTPPPSVGGPGGGFNVWEGDLMLPTRDDGRSLIVYGALDFLNSVGMVHIPIRHIDQTTAWEATYARGTKVANADGSGYTGKYMPLIRYPFANLREPMKSLLPSDLTPAYEYLLQYGNLAETFTPNVFLKGAVGDLNTAQDQVAILMWDFKTQTWVQIADGFAIVNGVLTVSVDKSTILAVMKKGVTSANTSDDICDDVRNPNRTPFRDANSHWATSFICKLYNLKAITGYTDGPFRGLFRPDNSITRGELLKIMMAAEGIQVDLTRVNSGFPDVPTYEWFAPYVTRAKELRLIDGYPDGTFQPFRQINRSEALKIILNASRKIDDGELAGQVARYSVSPPSRSSFNDITTSDWFAPYIDLAASKGIISGKSPGIFRAGDDMTRAEVSKVIQLTITLP